MGRKSKKSKKRARTGQLPNEEQDAVKNAPHSLIFHRGHVGRYVRELVQDLRKVMEPYTASHLKVRKRNALKDFISITGPMHVTHCLVLSKTELSPYLRLIKTPRGPTLTFKVESYTLARDIVSAQKNPCIEPKLFLYHPLLVMNNFSQEGKHFQLMTTMFQNMFPSIAVDKVKLRSVRRCVLVNYCSDTSTVEIRHYAIKVAPVGMSRGVKKLIKSKVPDLGKYSDISEFLMKGDASESEGEMETEEVDLPQKVPGRGNLQGAKSAIRLKEIGPRLTLRLIRIEDGISAGKLLYQDRTAIVTNTDVEMD